MEGGNGTYANLAASEGLRFTRNPNDPRNRIDLRWRQDANANTVGTDNPATTVRTQTAPNGYVIDRAIYAEDGTTTPVGWKSLFRADENYARNLASDIRYTDARDVKPGMRYTYRVFPTFIADGYEYGVPAMIDASSEQADLPDRVQGLMVAPTEDDDGNQFTSSLTLTWNAVTNNGGHEIKGYLVQVSRDTDKNLQLNTALDWDNLEVDADPNMPAVADNPDSITVDADTFEYDYAPEDTETPELTPGSVRWFRVIAITDENDGVFLTGGEQVNIDTGALRNPPDSSGSNASGGEELPESGDETRARPEYGKTAALPDPAEEPDPSPPAKPLDLTAELASDTNDLADDTGVSAQGIYLTWNEPVDSKPEIDSYKIEYKRMNTGNPDLDRTEWEQVNRTRITGETSFTHDAPLARDAEVRMYRVGSKANGVVELNYTDPVEFRLHLAHMPDAPMDVVATAGYDSASDWWETLNCRQMVAAVDLDYDGDPNSETGMPGDDSPNADIYCAHYPGSAAVMGGATALTTEATAVVDMKFAEKYPNMGKASIITVKWDAPSDGGSPITGYMVQSKYGDMNWMDVDPAHMGTGAMYIDKNLMSATAYYYQVKAMNAKGDSAAWSMMAMQTTGNTDPMAVGTIDPVTVTAGEMSDAMDVSGYFSDADMSDTLTYTAMPDMEMYATVAVDGSMVTITGVSAGMATVTVTANDGKGGTVMQTIMVTVPNSAPMAVGTIDPVTVTAGEMSDAMDVSGYFSDADMSDTLTYTAMPDMEMYATVAVDGSMVTITGVSAGMATVTVTANDGKGGIVMQTIMVTVEAADMTPTSPSNVMAIDATTNPGNLMITVTWTDGENVEAYGVVLFNSDFSEWPYIARGMDGSHTFTNVDAGSYVAVVVALNVDGTLLTDANGAYLFGPGNAVTIGQ